MKITLRPNEQKITWDITPEEQEHMMTYLAGVLINTKQFIPETPQIALPDGVMPDEIVFVPNSLATIKKEDMFNA
jgi:hypothetical protein